MGAWVYKNRPIIDIGLAIPWGVIFGGNVIVGHPRFRKFGTDAKLAVIAIRRTAFANHIFAKARPVLDSKNAADGTRCGAKRPADNSANRPSGSVASCRALFSAANRALCMCRHW